VRRRAGFTLVELTVVMVVLTLAIAMFSSTLASTAARTPLAREQTAAAEAARRQLEILRSEPFGEVFARFNAEAADDPDGPGTAPGPGFAVRGLRAMPDDADGLVGELLFPAIGAALREDLPSELFGTPRDLDGDTLIDDVDHAGDYIVLPVLVRVRWESAGGAERVFEMSTMFVDLEGTQ
jgi:prepilin-type N-terminal cleavage/methylation domain-containing protein